MPLAEQEKKRLFFGLEIEAPWPAKWPKGRLIEKHHCTLAFLGGVASDSIPSLIMEVPSPSFSIAPCGWFDSSLLLPPRHTHVVAWHVRWFDTLIAAYQKKLVDWLLEKELSVDKREWLPHVTVCRKPLEPRLWIDFFHPLPCFASALHLFESLGNSTYKPLWTFTFVPPFEEIEHMADIAFHVYGKELKDLYQNAFLALAFKDPALLNHLEEPPSIASLEEIVMLLNAVISKADRTSGCPFKAVSFHGEIHPYKNDLKQWEMIVDV